MAINHPGAIDTDLLITTYMTQLNKESVPNDIFDHLSSDYINASDNAPPELPEGIYMRLQQDANDSRYTRVAMVKDLSQAPTIGSNGDQRLNEEDIETKSFRMEYTDLSHATTNQKFGVLARDKFPYQIFEQRVPLLGRYFKQYFGKMRRQALLEIQSENLEDAPHFNTSNFSPNWYIPNQTNAQQPTYTDNAADWVDTLVASMLSAGTGVNAACSINYLQRLEDWARNEAFICPIDFPDGTDGYIVTLPSPQVRWLRHVVQTGNPGVVWQNITELKEAKFNYPNLVMKIGGLVIVEDQRYPTLSLAGSASNAGSYLYDSDADYILTARYRGQGRADDGSSDPRDKSANARQCGFLIGRAALCEWMPEAFHWEWEYEQYDKYFGSGIFCSVGIKQVIYNVHENSADSTTVQQDSSVVLPFANPPELNNYTAQTS